MLRVGSLFSGIGGFDLGLERAGMTVLWQVEIDKQCRSVLGKHFPGSDIREDVTVEGSATLAPVDLICGGFPCQDLSVAGRRAGLAGERSGLFFEFARILGELLPEWVLIENVPGLLSSSEGRDMGTILGALGKLGYWWAYRIIDAQYLGVAQRRRRVFIVGHLGDGRCAEVLFDAESLSRTPPARGEAGERVAGTLEARASTGGYDPGAHGAASGHVVTALSAKWSKGTSGPAGDEHHNLVTRTLSIEGADASDDGTGRGTPIVTAFNWQSGGDCRINPTEGRTDGLHSGQTPAVAFSVNQRREGRLRDVHGSLNGEPSGTQVDGVLTYPTTSANEGGSLTQIPPIANGSAPRRLTPRECERLQGFPDDWTSEGAEGQISDSARYRMLGNAVAVPVAEWIGRRIANA